MPNRYYQPKANRSPDERRRYRKDVELAPVSDTVESRQARPLDTTDKDTPTDLSRFSSQPLSDAAVPPRTQLTIGLVVKVGVGVFVFVGAVVGILVFITSLSSRITETSTNVTNIQTTLTEQGRRIDSTFDRAIDYVDRQIDILRADLQSLKGDK